MSRTAQAFGQRCPYDLVLGQLARAMLPGRGRHLGIRYGCVVPAKGVTERAYVRLGSDADCRVSRGAGIVRSTRWGSLFVDCRADAGRSSRHMSHGRVAPVRHVIGGPTAAMRLC